MRAWETAAKALYQQCKLEIYFLHSKPILHSCYDRETALSVIVKIIILTVLLSP